ncbi:polysaccharide biosynthesis/export family protein [Flavobacteriaceae bacterium S356]|uniref:Polysaccharide biosynthesis/export family protein n=1 Tax=Asprobacillus argus TaxID=3076534 RepID=A0ABU3LJR8_9FLAO|nr:polysaccharide biosynthesis/export family protein [Flavobacteriaceae bacterium S356]
MIRTCSNYISVVLVLFFLSSCVSKKKIVYFQNGAIDQENVSNNYKTTFKADDLLEIIISAKDDEAVKPFNLSAVAFSNTTNNPIGTPQQQLYLIDSKGEIVLPILGNIKIGGLTKEQGISLIKDKLDPEYVKDPSVNIRITNFKITVLGDVIRPGVYNVPNERISIMEAIGLAGDLNISGVRDSIKVTREEGGVKKIYNVNLLSNEVFSSPVYYLQQNDLVYVKPNKAKMQSASYNQNTGLFVSIGSILISLLAILSR